MQPVKGGEVSFTDIVAQHKGQKPEADRDEGQTDNEHGEGNTSARHVRLCEELLAVFQQHLDRTH